MTSQPTADVIDLQVVRSLKRQIVDLEHQLESSRVVVGHLFAQLEELKAERAQGGRVVPLYSVAGGAGA